jgi:hypothetical protein
VGLDAYPGTFFPPSAPRGTHGQFLLDAFSLLRKCYLPTARIPQQVPIHVQENGFPTGPGRSYEDQLAAMESMLGALLEYRRTFNVTDHRWFAMRDADSGSPNFQQQYGMLRDDYAEKPAFDRYRRFVEENGPPPREPEPPRGFGLSGRCYSRGVLVSLAGRGVLRVEFRVRGKRARDRRPPFRRHVRLRRGQPRRVPLRAYVRMNDGSLLPASGRGPRCPVR